jgi:hypothetical protein
MKTRNTDAQTRNRQLAAEPGEKESVRAVHDAVGNGLQHAGLQRAIDQSPRMLAQRQALQVAFGSAFQRRGDDEGDVDGAVQACTTPAIQQAGVDGANERHIAQPSAPAGASQGLPKPSGSSPLRHRMPVQPVIQKTKGAAGSEQKHEENPLKRRKNRWPMNIIFQNPASENQTTLRKMRIIFLQAYLRRISSQTRMLFYLQISIACRCGIQKMYWQ